MKVSMESPEVKSGNTGQPRATREIPPLYIFSQAGTCPGVPGRNLRGTSTSSSREQRTRATPFAPGRHSFAPGGGCSYNGFVPVGAPPSVRTGPAHIRTRGGCSYRGFIPVGAPPSVRTGQAHIRTRGGCSYDGSDSCRSTALGANRGQLIFAPGAGAPTAVSFL